MRLGAPPAGGATFFSLACPCKAWHNRIIFLSKVRDTMRAEQNTRWFLAAEAVLYLAFLCCDLQSVFSISTALKYAALLLCLFYSAGHTGSEDGRLVCAALTLTAAADFFLLVLNRWYFLGVALFCPVQFLYALRLRRMQISPGPLWPRAAASGGALLMLGLSGLLRPLTMLICVYFPQLLCNAVESLRPSSAHGAPLFRCGLWLFVGCDICVGLHNLVPYLPLSAGSAAAVQFCMWALYLPSQVLIALSVRRRPTA